MPEPDTPRLAFPPSFDPVAGSRLADQGTIDEIVQCVDLVLTARVGSLIDRPQMGIHDQAFRQGGADLDELQAAVEATERRAITTITASDIRERAESIGITVAGGSE